MCVLRAGMRAKKKRPRMIKTLAYLCETARRRLQLNVSRYGVDVGGEQSLCYISFYMRNDP